MYIQLLTTYIEIIHDAVYFIQDDSNLAPDSVLIHSVDLKRRSFALIYARVQPPL